MARSNANAWREILARIFSGLQAEYNVTPNWLRNPETNRQLKLDLLYPEIGVAIRLSGLRGTQQRARPSLDEVAQQRKRDEARLDLCEAHGISLADLPITTAEPDKAFKTLELALSRATRRLAKTDALPEAEKASRKEKLMQCRSLAMGLSRRIRSERDLSLYYDLWLDRQVRESETRPERTSNEPPPKLAEGMLVEHAHFGVGLVQTLTEGKTEQDALVTIHFESGEEKQFMAGLLGGKITIQG